MADFDFYCDGSVCTFTPRSAAAVDWCDEHLPEDCPMLGNAYVVETRYADDILDGIAADGLVVR